jgi:hypothetical protein
MVAERDSGRPAPSPEMQIAWAKIIGETVDGSAPATKGGRGNTGGNRELSRRTGVSKATIRHQRKTNADQKLATVLAKLAPRRKPLRRSMGSPRSTSSR